MLAGDRQAIITVPHSPGPGFLTAGLNFSSYLTLRLEAGARMIASARQEDYVVRSAFVAGICSMVSE